MLNYWNARLPSLTETQDRNDEPSEQQIPKKRAKRQKTGQYANSSSKKGGAESSSGSRRSTASRSRRAAWTAGEDYRLRQAVMRYDANRWTLIAAEVNEGRILEDCGSRKNGVNGQTDELGMIRTAEQCRHRWNRTLRHQHQCETGEWRSGPWTVEDDALLMELVRYGMVGSWCYWGGFVRTCRWLKNKEESVEGKLSYVNGFADS
jgi:hypothetical protein